MIQKRAISVRTSHNVVTSTTIDIQKEEKRGNYKENQ